MAVAHLAGLPGADTTQAAPTDAAGAVRTQAQVDQGAAPGIAGELHRSNHVRNHARLPLPTGENGRSLTGRATDVAGTIP